MSEGGREGGREAGRGMEGEEVEGFILIVAGPYRMGEEGEEEFI